jgi:hypothetical protein
LTLRKKGRPDNRIMEIDIPFRPSHLAAGAWVARLT